MRSDVQSAALRAAAKVAFSVAFIGGCAAQAAEADDATNPDGTEPATTAEADLSAKNKTKKKSDKTSALPSGCHHEDASVPQLSCEQVVAAAFPTEGHYPGKKQSVSAEVQTCCAELLSDRDGGLASASLGLLREPPRRRRSERRHRVHAVGPAGPALDEAPRAVDVRHEHPGGGVMLVLDLRDAAKRNRPAVPQLPHLREAAIGTWRGRMINEHSSARVFDGLAYQFELAGAPGRRRASSMASQRRSAVMACSAGRWWRPSAARRTRRSPKARTIPRTRTRTRRSKQRSATC